MIGIYKITNLVNGKCYIGQSRNIEKRFSAHKSRPFNENSEEYNKVLYRAIRKYGLDNFSFEVIEECKIELLNNRENYWINFFDATNPTKGYNQTCGEYNLVAKKMTDTLLKQIIQDLQNSNLSIKEIAEKYNFHSNMITNINQGHSWRQEDLEYPIRKIHKKVVNYCIDCNTIISDKATRCIACEHLKQRISNRPSREELKKLIRTTPFTQIGKMYNVSDNSIRKWCKSENLPSKSSEIKKYSDEEWEKI